MVRTWVYLTNELYIVPGHTALLISWIQKSHIQNTFLKVSLVWVRAIVSVSVDGGVAWEGVA